MTMTYDGSTIRLYVDGALSNSQSQPGTLSYSNTFSIGDGYEGAWYPFK